MELIDKDAILAEIDRQKIGYNVDGKHSVEYDITRKILDIINTLEVKEVNLDEEVEQYIFSKGLKDYGFLIPSIAKHFFELGLKAARNNN